MASSKNKDREKNLNPMKKDVKLDQNTKKIPLCIIGIPLNFIELSEQDFPSSISKQAYLSLSKANIIITSERIYKAISRFAIFSGIKFHTYEKPLALKLKETLATNHSKKLVILAAGDPNFYGIAATIYKFKAEIISKYNITVYNNISSIQLALSRLHWGLAETQIVSLHGRPLRSLITKLNYDKKIIIIPNDDQTLNKLTTLLTKFAKPSSDIHILENLACKDEKISHINLANYKQRSIKGLYLLGLNLYAKNPQIFPGLSDDNFIHDGQITKHEMRSLILNRLLRFSSGCLWDIGSGSGSISVEWLQYPNNSAILFEKDKVRISNITKNLEFFGLSNYQIINKNIKGETAEFEGLTKPKAIFIGANPTKQLLDFAKRNLAKQGGIIIACFVTLNAWSIILNDYFIRDNEKSNQFKKDIIGVNIEKAVDIKKSSPFNSNWMSPKHQIGLYILTKDL